MIICNIHERVAWLSIDDGKANALNPSLFKGIENALDQAEQAKAELVVLEGRLNIFSAGLDLKLIPTLSVEDKKEVLSQFAKTMTRLFLFPIPTVAAITGHAIAGGAILAYACDKRFFLEGPYFIQLNEIVNNMNIPSWMLAIAKFRVPAHLLTEITLHSRGFSPNEALEKGLVHGILKKNKDISEQVIEGSRDLLNLNLNCYRTTKNRLFGDTIRVALDKLTNE